MFRKFGKIALLCSYLLLTTIVVIFSISNRQIVSLDLFPLPFTIDTPLFFFGFVMFSMGVLLGGMFFSLKTMRTRSLLKKQNKRKDALENEVAALRAETLSLTHVSELSKKAS